MAFERTDNWFQGDRFEYLGDFWIFQGCLGGHTMEVTRESNGEVAHFPVGEKKNWRLIRRASWDKEPSL